MKDAGVPSIQAICRGVADGWCLVARNGVHGFALQLPAGSLGCGGEPLADMNWACVAGRDGAGEAVRRFVQALDERGLPGILSLASWVGDEADEVAEAAGLERSQRPNPLMAAELEAGPVDTGAVEVRAVRDEAGLEAAGLVLADAYDCPLETIQNMVGPRVPPSSAVTWFVGYARGRPASACALARTGDVVGVYSVGTAHAHRRQGAARATIGAALAGFAARGVRVAGLLSGTDAIPLYEGLGFRVVDEPSEWSVLSGKAV